MSDLARDADLTSDQRQALEDFRDLRISIKDFRVKLRNRISFDFRPPATADYTRGIQKNSAPAEPPVPVTLEHIRRAYKKWASAEVTLDEISDWAAMIIMNDDYDLPEPEQEMVAVWLNDAANDRYLTSPDPC